MFKKIKCFLGFHKWKYFERIEYPEKRKCELCDKIMFGHYDMSYGEIWWSDNA